MSRAVRPLARVSPSGALRVDEVAGRTAGGGDRQEPRLGLPGDRQVGGDRDGVGGDAVVIGDGQGLGNTGVESGKADVAHAAPGVEHPDRGQRLIRRVRVAGQEVAGDVDDDVGLLAGGRGLEDRGELAVAGERDREVVGPGVTERDVDRRARRVDHRGRVTATKPADVWPVTVTLPVTATASVGMPDAPADPGDLERPGTLTLKMPVTPSGVRESTTRSGVIPTYELPPVLSWRRTYSRRKPPPEYMLACQTALGTCGSCETPV